MKRDKHAGGWTRHASKSELKQQKKLEKQIAERELAKRLQKQQ